MEINEEDEVEIKNLVEELSKVPTLEERKPIVVEFEKDDPTNFHI